MDRDRGHGGDIPPMIWIKEKDDLLRLGDPSQLRLITDEHLAALYPSILASFPAHIVIEPKEESKQVQHLGKWLDALLELETDRQSLLLGLGGGLTTDLTGFLASVYMRGLDFGLVPTSLLAMVDAALGGKTAMNHRLQKNFIGTIRHPKFIVFYLPFLDTLPCREWANGFAEIIKHACIRDAVMFHELEERSLRHYRRRQTAICELVQRNALIKAKIVQQDEFEKNERRLLNFGHTLAHALENQYEMMHGHAVSIGMHCACHISEQLTGFKQTDRVVKLLEKYGLPTYLEFDRKKAFGILKMDKKRERKDMNYVLLDKIGRARIQSLPLVTLEKFISNF